MKSSFGLKYLVSLVLTVLIVWQSPSSSSLGYEEGSFHDTLYADGCGGFYALSVNGQRASVYQANGDKLVPVGTTETMTVSDVVCVSGQVFLLLPFDGMTGVYSPSGSLTAFLDNCVAKKGCTVITADHTLYTVDERTPQIIGVYTHLQERKKMVKAPSAVRRLFTAFGSQTVCALTETGVFLPESGRLLSCELPREPFSLNEGIACDADGTVYTFDEVYGFRRRLTTHCTPLGYAGGAFYTYTEATIWQLDDTGERVASYVPTAQPITALAVSGSQIAVLSGETFVMCHANRFQPIPKEVSSGDMSIPEPSSATVSQVSQQEVPAVSVVSVAPPQPSQVSVPMSVPASEVSSDSKPSDLSSNVSNTVSRPSVVKVTSDVYTIGEDTITDIPLGTTLAVLKKHLVYPSCTLTVYNHHGKLCTSGTVGTGFCLQFSLDGQTVRTYYTVLRGDISGEGNSNNNDLTTYAQFLVGKTSLNRYQQLGGDMDGDGRCAVADLYLLQRRVKGM